MSLVHDLLNLAHDHPIWIALLLSWVFSAFVDGMPDPAGHGLAYAWLYRSSHSLAGNISEARKKFAGGGE